MGINIDNQGKKGRGPDGCLTYSGVYKKGLPIGVRHVWVLSIDVKLKRNGPRWGALLVKGSI